MASIPTGSKPWPSPGWPIAALKALPPTAPASPAHVGCGYWARFTRPDSQTAKRRLAFKSQAAFFICYGSDRERRPAPTRRGGIRVLDHETRTFQTFLVIHLGTCQVLEAHRVHDQADAFALDDSVIIGHIFIEGKTVLKP